MTTALNHPQIIQPINFFNIAAQKLDEPYDSRKVYQGVVYMKKTHNVKKIFSARLKC